MWGSAGRRDSLRPEAGEHPSPACEALEHQGDRLWQLVSIQQQGDEFYNSTSEARLFNEPFFASTC